MKRFRSPRHRPHVSGASINRNSLMACQEGRGDGTGATPRPSASAETHVRNIRTTSRTGLMDGADAVTSHCIISCVHFTCLDVLPRGRSERPRTCIALLCPSLNMATYFPLSLCPAHTHIYTHTLKTYRDLYALIMAWGIIGGGYHVVAVC